jgi:hypothetical protein
MTQVSVPAAVPEWGKRDVQRWWCLRMTLRTAHPITLR